MINLGERQRSAGGNQPLTWQQKKAASESAAFVWFTKSTDD